MTPVAQAVLAALAFGLSPPLAKILLASVSAILLAGLLYAGAGLFLTAVRLMRSRSPRGRPVTSRDWWILAAAITAGGVLAPPLLLWGLARTPASQTALLLNLEVVFTALLARVLFREHLGARAGAASVLMALGGISLGWRDGALDVSLPALAVAGACALWALDNNVTRLIADVDAVVLAQVKGLVAGAVNLALGLGLAHQLPPWDSVAWSLGLGAVSYGGSLVLFIMAMRGLGAARTAAYFALAPLFGAAGGVVLLGEGISVQLLLAAGLMAAGGGLLAGERHAHRHRHDGETHTHRHVRDDHHQHAHEGSEGPEPHVHPHATGPLEHSHAHTPDQDHRHGHA